MNQQQQDILSSLEQGQPLTPEQAAALLEFGDPTTGDTGATPDTGAAPSGSAGGEQPTPQPTNQQQDGKGAEPAAATTTKEGDPTKTPTEAELNAENAVILAKDGKHTISYDKLVEARSLAQQYKADADRATQELEQLRKQLNPGDGTKPPLDSAQLNQVADAAVKDGIDPAVFGDFSDAAIVKGIATVIDQKIAGVMAQLDAKLAPLNQRHEVDAAAEHNRAILTAHPDASSVAQSQELRAWIDKQPSFVRSQYDTVLEKGTSAQVIELFDAFKQATGVKTPTTTTTPSAEDVKAAAAAAIAKAQATPPGSLSDLVGGRPGAGATREDAWAQMDGVALLDAMADASPEQIERFLNRRV